MGEAGGFGVCVCMCIPRFSEVGRGDKADYDCRDGKDEAMQKKSMLPLQVYLSSASSLSASRWRMIDPSALSPWKVVEWGWRQLTGFLVGWEGSLSSTTLREQQLVLVDNLKVCLGECGGFGSRVNGADLGRREQSRAESIG